MKKLIILLMLMAACRPQMLRFLASPELFDLVKEESKLLNEEAGCKWIDEEFDVVTEHRDIVVHGLSEDDVIYECGQIAWGCFQFGDIYMIDHLGWKEHFRFHEDRAKRLVFLHELGHAMGLEHSKDLTNFMTKNVQLELSPEEARKQLVEAIRPCGLTP